MSINSTSTRNNNFGDSELAKLQNLATSNNNRKLLMAQYASWCAIIFLGYVFVVANIPSRIWSLGCEATDVIAAVAESTDGSFQGNWTLREYQLVTVKGIAIRLDDESNAQRGMAFGLASSDVDLTDRKDSFVPKLFFYVNGDSKTSWEVVKAIQNNQPLRCHPRSISNTPWCLEDITSRYPEIEQEDIVLLFEGDHTSDTLKLTGLWLLSTCIAICICWPLWNAAGSTEEEKGDAAAL